MYISFKKCNEPLLIRFKNRLDEKGTPVISL